MAYDCAITQALLRRQQDMFLEAANRGVTHKAIHYQTKLSLSVIGQYARGETAMSMPSMLKIMTVVGNELVSMLLDDGDAIVNVPDGLDHDGLADSFRDYLREKDHAHHPDSPAGREIAPCEDARLSGLVVNIPINGRVA